MDISYYKKYEPIFGEWKIVREIGEGSFGKVFEIEREDFGYTYKAALKAITIPQNKSEIKSALSDGMDEESASTYFRGFVEEMVGEFVTMSRLKGISNVVSYEDHKVIPHEDGIGWDILIRMELLTPLIDRVRENPLSREDVIKLGIDMCKALEACRTYQIIHRDIKPENIFVSKLGDYKLGDFGIAKTVEKTMGGLSKKGTYTYMAPEVYKGEKYGASVDIYSLGIVLYRYMNNSRAPFLPDYPLPIKYTDRDTALLRRISGEALPVPANADAELAKIILKACAYNPEDRYQSPTEMRTALEALSSAGAKTICADRIIETTAEGTTTINMSAAPSEKPTVKEAAVPFKAPIKTHEAAAIPAENEETLGIFSKKVTPCKETVVVEEASSGETEVLDENEESTVILDEEEILPEYAAESEEAATDNKSDAELSSTSKPKVKRTIIAIAITALYMLPFHWWDYGITNTAITSLCCLTITVVGMLLFKPKGAGKFFATLGMEIVSAAIALGLHILFVYYFNDNHCAAIVTLIFVIIAVTLVPALIIEIALRIKKKNTSGTESAEDRKKFKETIILTVVLDLLLIAFIVFNAGSDSDAVFYEYEHDASGNITWYGDRNLLTNNNEDTHFSYSYEYNSNAENGEYDYYTRSYYRLGGTVYSGSGQKVLRYSVNELAIWDYSNSEYGYWESVYSPGHGYTNTEDWLLRKLESFCESLGIEAEYCSGIKEVFNRDTGEYLAYVLTYYEPGTEDYVTRKYDADGNLLYTYNWHYDYDNSYAIEQHYNGDGELIYEETYSSYDRKIKVSLNLSGGFPLRIEIHSYEV